MAAPYSLKSARGFNYSQKSFYTLNGDVHIVKKNSIFSICVRGTHRDLRLLIERCGDSVTDLKNVYLSNKAQQTVMEAFSALKESWQDVVKNV